MMLEIKETMVVNRVADVEKVYMVYDLTSTKVKLCPYDTDSKNAGARRTAISKSAFWNVYEIYEGDL